MYRQLALSMRVGLKPGRRVSAEALWAVRPKGELLWLHAATQADLAALTHLIPRLDQLDPLPNILLTLPDGLDCPGALPDHVLIEKLPDDTAAQCTAFAHHFHPDMAVICGSPIPMRLVWAMDRIGIPMTLVNCHNTDLDPNGFRIDRPARQALVGCFAQIICRDETSARILNRLRKGKTPCLGLGRLEEGCVAPEADPDLLDEMRPMFTGRPMWLAAHTRPGEEPMVAEAQRQMGRISHRLLCVIAPDDPSSSGDLVRSLTQQGWRVARRSMGDTIAEDIQIVVVDVPDELGLWYRLAPITFMGSSLVPGYGGQDPFAPATLGSAVLYGPNVGNHLDSYSRLVNAGGARIVKDASSLAQGLQLLLAPDKSAAQAHAAWDVVSRGAQVTDKVIAILQDQLDEKVF